MRTRNGTPLALLMDTPECFPHPVEAIRVVETHISWVILTGRYAYKIKKPVNMGFLDFSTLGDRGHYCNEEVRLNRRFAPDLYLDVVEIRGTLAAPRVSGRGAMLEYAVRMKQFPDDALGLRMLENGKLTPGLIAAFARRLADFHGRAAVASASGALGSGTQIGQATVDNLNQLQTMLSITPDRNRMAGLRLWSLQEHERLTSVFQQRLERGRVREGHGDLHLGNIVDIDGELTAFDCIDFSDALRWNDVMSDVAFLFMDLVDRGAPALAWTFLDRYLEETGDFDGLEVLPFYVVYRALVRAKIHVVRAQQLTVLPSARPRLMAACCDYMDLASTYARIRRGGIVVMHGLSGSGKSTVAAAAAATLGAVRVRTDVERKRLHGLRPNARTASALARGAYDARFTRRVYAHVAGLASRAARAGFRVVIDGAFLKRWQRNVAAAAARDAGVPFVVLALDAPVPVLRERILRRLAMGQDASEATEAVLDHQISAYDPLEPDELQWTVRIDAGDGPAPLDLQRVDRMLTPSARST